MLSTLLRAFSGSPKAREEEDALLRGAPGHVGEDEQPPPRHATADFTEGDDDDESNEGGLGGFVRSRGAEDEDGQRQSTHVLPLFSSTHLDALPVYNIVHAIRIIVQTRTETTLTWEQLRSPQISQFLVKPMQQQIRTELFSRATLYALLANCLQFAKEAQIYPGNAGASSTRAKVCELLAIKLLKEYSTRELIDALSYDFYPLQGLPGHQTPLAPLPGKPRPGAARTSTLEVAIRASAKRFLAHPLVVQQLEAIWNGAISFYSSADSLHRNAPASAPSSNRWSRRSSADPRTPLLGQQQSLKEARASQGFPPGRRTVTLYDPRNASLFKLSRLRVPRYRQFLSTCSLAILLGLFLAVLVRRSSSITSLELIFWFWSAGYMLDELVGFNDQGFSLYIMSFWNIFDIGILVLLIVYYCMRLYGVFLVDAHKWNQRAFDILAANAILLLPRIYSVLDRYQYFSQLLIAFRLMAVDLAAVFVLVLISCSGFFVFFTLSRNDNDAGEVAYQIFQILMGFTPAAWEVWPEYDWLGRSVMALFLIICHFVVVTILITVLTNSFMAIAHNANEEHQFLFAINTISMVKNDALFSYIAPSNIFAWMLLPLRFCLSLSQFVALNRLVIKTTHFPLLFCIFFYERLFLAPYMYEPTDLVENPGRGRQGVLTLGDPASRTALFTPNIRVREESVVGFQKDRALEEVFRRAPDMATLRAQRRNERRKTQTAIRTWMDQNEGFLGSPHNYSTMDSSRPNQEWQRRLSMRGDRTGHRLRQLSEVRSTASDPVDLMSNVAFPATTRLVHDGIDRRDYAEMEVKDHTDADGDDEFVTNDEDEDDDKATNRTRTSRSHQPAPPGPDAEDYFTIPGASRSVDIFAEPAMMTQATPTSPKPGPSRRGLHSRTMSTNTILYRGPEEPPQETPPSSPQQPQPRSRPLSTRHGATPVESPAAIAHRPPRRSVYLASRPRPIPPSRSALAAPDPRRPSSLDAAPADLGRLVLARMEALESGFAGVVREMRALQRGDGGAGHGSASEEGGWRAGRAEVIEVAGTGRAKMRAARPGGSLEERPASRLSMREEKVGLGLEGKGERRRMKKSGKGKQVRRSDADGSGSQEEGGGFGRKGSSL